MRLVTILLGLLLLTGCHGQSVTAPDFPDTGGQPSVPAPVFEHGFVTAQSHGFYNDGQPWQYRGATAFSLFQRYLDGENITPLVLTYKDGGANTLRVLGMWTVNDFNPARYGESYWSGLGRFADELAKNEIRLEFVVFADAQRIIPNTAAQDNHVQWVYATLAGKWNVFIELVNEAELNGIDPTRFQRPTNLNVLVSAGSAGGGLSNPVVWDYTTFHPERNGYWFSSPNFTSQGVPLVLDEPMGAAEFDQPGRRDSNPDHFYQFGKRVFDARIAGATFHSENGLYALPLGPTEKECMRQLFLGMSGK